MYSFCVYFVCVLLLIVLAGGASLGEAGQGGATYVFIFRLEIAFVAIV